MKSSNNQHTSRRNVRPWPTKETYYPVTFETGLDGSRPVNQYAKRLDRRSNCPDTHTQTHKTGCSTWPTEVVNNDEKRRPAQQWSSCCVWATTLNFGPNVQIHNRTYWPKYGPPRPISTGTASPEKNLEIRFFAKMAAKNTVPVFGHILVLHPRLGRISQKSRKMFRGTFWDIWGQSWILQKLFKRVTKLYRRT